MTLSIAALMQSELEDLVSIEKDICVSLYMPTHKSGAPSLQEDPIRLKNLLSDAEQQLSDRGLSESDIDAILKPARELLAPDARHFWQHQSHGLAIFLADGIYYHYRLPVSFETRAIVGDRFSIKPLLQLLSGNGRFYILALSLQQVQLYQATQHNLEAVELNELPQGIDAALQYDDPERSPQVYGGRGNTVRYGQGASTDDRKDEIRRYFDKVDNALHSVLHDENAPLVLVGVDYLLPIFREASQYNRIIDRVVEGNPENTPLDTLHVQGWNAVAPHFQAQQNMARSQFHELTGTGQATSDLTDILPAAYDGQIDTLFVARGERRWGAYDPETRHLTAEGDGDTADEDLLESAAIYTLLQGGTVFAVEPDAVPEDAPLAAVFRYPVIAGQAGR